VEARVPSYGSLTLLSVAENISAGNMADSSLRFFFFLIFPNRGFRETLHSVHTDNA